MKRQTMGDRIVALLRQHDNMEQAELLRLLNAGDPINGRPAVACDKSYLSRIINDKIDNPRREIIYAITDILGTDLEWLERGRVVDERSSYGPRAQEAADLIEAMDPDLQEWALDNIRRVRVLDVDRKAHHSDLIKMADPQPRRIRSNALILQKIGV